MWSFDNLGQMHIELTNGCNAACPMCVRFHCSSPLVRPDIKITQITLDTFKQWFPEDIIQKTDLILFCGVHGDPSVARDMYEICEYISNCSNTKILVNTNGGARKPEWWEKLGLLFAKNTSWELTFSIDGLEDTNHIYRRNVVWKKLEANVKAFTKNGAKSDWDFLMFKHNEHQIEEAKKKCKEWGITNFVPKKALGVDNGKSLQGMPALNDRGELDYWIEAPEDPSKRNLETPVENVTIFKHHNFDVDQYREMKKQNVSSNNYQKSVENVYSHNLKYEDTSHWDKATISCKSKLWGDKTEIFVDSDGIVMPCCYIGTHLNGVYTDFKSMQLHYHMNNYGWDNFNLNKHSLENILKKQHLNRVFSDSWDKESVKCGKLAYCSETCGKFSSIDNIFTHEDVENESKYRFKKNG